MFLAGAQTCRNIALNRENVGQKYRNRVSECSLSPLLASLNAIIAQ